MESHLKLMESHVKLLGILHIIFGAMGVLSAFAILALASGIAEMLGMPANGSDAVFALPVFGIGVVIAILMLLISVPGVIGGIALVRHAHWARFFMIVISACELPNFPLGTALGVYGIWVLTRHATVEMFGHHAH
jgi:hypothetical protein